MDNRETIQSFGDMVEATEKMASPWRDTVWKLIKALIFTNLFWAIVLGLFIWLAYFSPETSVQYQDFNGEYQAQSTGTETVTFGD